MKETFDDALTFVSNGNIQESIKVAENLSFDRFLDFIFYCKVNTNSLKNPIFWTSLFDTKQSVQFFKQSNSYFFLSVFFRQRCAISKHRNIINYCARNHPNCLVKAIRVSKSFLDEAWYSVFQKSFQDHENQHLRVYFQCFALLRQIDKAQWSQVEKKSSYLKSFKNSPLELLNELALWYDLNPDSHIQGKSRIVVDVLNIAIEFLMKNDFLAIDGNISDKEILEANLKAWKRVENYEENGRVSPVFDWLNSIKNWRESTHIFLQKYCFDLNFEPFISSEGIISLRPVSIEKIKGWENNGIKTKFMFHHYLESAKEGYNINNNGETLQGPPMPSLKQEYESFIDTFHLSAEKAWLDTFSDENFYTNGEIYNFKSVSQFFRKYSKSCLLNQNDSKLVEHYSLEKLKENFDESNYHIDSSTLMNFFICNIDPQQETKKFNRLSIKTNLCSTPFLKFRDHLFAFNSILTNTRPHTFLFDNLLNQNELIINKGTKNEYKLSSKFEDRISVQFENAGFNTNLNNDKKFKNDETGESGDIDALAYKDGILFVIEAKLAAIRVTVEDAHNELSTAFLKGASQLNKVIKFIEWDFHNIREKLDIKELSFNDLKICPLIVSTSFESDHEYIEWGNMHFLKISWHELMMILNEEYNPKKIIERIETNDYWKFLDVMPTPSFTEKSIPFALLSEPTHPNSDELYKLANSYYENEKYNEAKNAVKQAIEKDENDSDFYILLGDCYSELNEFESAKTAYETAIGIDPFNALVYNSFGCLLQENKQWEHSYKCFKKAIELNPLDDVIINSYESACGFLVENGIWTIQHQEIALLELVNRIKYIKRINTISQFS